MLSKIREKKRTFDRQEEEATPYGGLMFRFIATVALD
jgi:hypothetical protein